MNYVSKKKIEYTNSHKKKVETKNINIITTPKKRSYINDSNEK